ncbi:spore germination protein [Clostridium felsineum]|uniref:spore germination protein n=1 Tax=Clostridium felsineum TaxID=36839 RepID=UPI00214D3D7E|nr:spore germination protein [Clostridium felsineum]MCR3757651.1 spore germination protein [Clostridium felsineum]
MFNKFFNDNTEKKSKETIEKISNNLKSNRKHIEQSFSNCSDIAIREFKIANNPHFPAMIVYIENLIESDVIESSVVERLTKEPTNKLSSEHIFEYSKSNFAVDDKNIYKHMNDVIIAVLKGSIALFMDGSNKAIIINIGKPPERSISEPNVETTIRGPREGFTESITTNVALLRKKIRSTSFKSEEFTLGKSSKTTVTIAYLSDVANPKIVQEIRERLGKIDTDSIDGMNYIKEYIQDEPFSAFPTMYSTERPDSAASKIFEGRIAILADGTPIVCTAPATFFEFLENTEDFFINFIPATINRWIRYISIFISIVLPGLYVAITTFHQELIQTPLLITFIQSHSSVPYPTSTEVFVLLVVYQIMIEAGIRMPRAVGQSISIIGALIIGQSAVEAGLISTPVIIVAAITYIASFAVPNNEMHNALTLPRFIFTILGASLGLFGLTCAYIVLSLKLISIRSFGVPYVMPIAPASKNDFLDILFKRPIWAKLKRSPKVSDKNSTKRQTRDYVNVTLKDIKKAIDRLRKSH